ncbi:hypothetical protein KIH31_16935 [Paenarthrobacter sp. DKR-5]|uniref:hypothetical protein n=1 Tax=Paenarthrobacter sp. DKR-5 TaxID=2835535 RepID=UPI001BDBBF66|nr:hypothetical protein [Paenarthrobacter sp. DKR-5]MBT1004274.1 hypothetical protein [Paenarthrobacter sp. DKR-5]
MTVLRSPHRRTGAPAEYIADWTLIQTDDRITLFRDGVEVSDGTADGVTYDGRFLWLVQAGGKGRSMFSRNDGLVALRTRFVTWSGDGAPSAGAR